MNGECDLIVIGAGPSGAEAALAASEHGVSVLLVDEATDAGGQVFRAPPSAFRGLPNSPEASEGNLLRQRVASSPIATRFGHLVWSVSPDLRVDALASGGPVSWRGRAVITATGAQERVVPFPGWTLPGVIGLAGATTLLKSQRMLPGRRTLVAGQGPLLIAVANAIIKAGGEVSAVVDLSSLGDWLARTPAFASRLDLVARGAAWRARIHRSAGPYLYRHAIRRADPRNDGQIDVVVGPVNGEGRAVEGAELIFTVDAVAVGNGLTASTDVTRLLRADHDFDEMRGGWFPRIDVEFRTSIPGLYATGDGTGIAGAAAASVSGRLAGLAVAYDLGALSSGAYEDKARPLRQKLKRARRFGTGMARLMALKPGQVDSITKDAVVCRCEEVTRHDIETAVAEGAHSANQLKAWTRCGMGPCQGRICGDIVSALVARICGHEPRSGMFTGRSPFRPLPLDQLIGSIEYADLKLPPSAPL